MTGSPDRNRRVRAISAVDRRTLLGAIGATATVGVAGCLGDDDEDAPESGSENGGDASNDGDGNGNDTGAGDDAEGSYDDEHLFDHPGDEPVEFADQSCPVCGMTASDYPDWQCQLAHEDGSGAAFDTPGCLFAYVAFPATDSEITAGWVTEYDTGELIDATEAHYVLVTDETAVRGETMIINPRPFADREDAVAYLDEWDAEELTEDDIIGLEDVDRDAAAIYRGDRFP